VIPRYSEEQLVQFAYYLVSNAIEDISGTSAQEAALDWFGGQPVHPDDITRTLKIIEDATIGMIIEDDCS